MIETIVAVLALLMFLCPPAARLIGALLRLHANAMAAACNVYLRHLCEDETLQAIFNWCSDCLRPSREARTP